MAGAPPMRLLLAAAVASQAVARGLWGEDAGALQAAMEGCAGVHGGGSGPAFAGCVEGRAGKLRSSEQQEILRNFSCAQDDGGSPILRSFNITVPSGYDVCEANSVGDEAGPSHGSAHPDYVYKPKSFLPAGNDIDQGTMTAAEAAEHCNALDSCAGFTFQAKSKDGPATVYFKSDASGHQIGNGWHTYRRRQPQVCSASPAEADTRTFQVDVVREEPLVAMVRGFAASSDCELLVREGGDWASMGRAYTSGGKHNANRRSYSKNIYPPLQDANSELMRLVARMFSVTRNLTGYKVFPPGQEPLNAVLYREVGDEYRPHCDGTCNGAKHIRGERIATSIVYCKTAELGGHTSFTKAAHKVVPAEGDLLLFAYRLPNGRMTGNEAEHSGCPIRKGQKWVATQWYREGVGESWNWQDAKKHRLEEIVQQRLAELAS